MVDSEYENFNQEVQKMRDSLNIRHNTTSKVAPGTIELTGKNHHLFNNILNKIVVNNPEENMEHMIQWASQAQNTVNIESGQTLNQLVLHDNFTDSNLTSNNTTPEERREHMSIIERKQKEFMNRHGDSRK